MSGTQETALTLARDRELHGKNPAHRQTVGGQVKWAVLGIPEEL